MEKIRTSHYKPQLENEELDSVNAHIALVIIKIEGDDKVCYSFLPDTFIFRELRNEGKSMEFLVPIVIEATRTVFKTLLSYIVQFRNYLIELDKEFYVVELFILFTFICYKSNWVAGILIVIMFLTVLGTERHFVSITEIIELN